MHQGAKRTAALSAAILGFALIGTGCHTTKDKTDEALNSASSAASSAASVAGSAASSAGSAASSAASSAIAGSEQNPEPTKIGEYTVTGPILAKYNSLDEAKKADLGNPIRDQQENPDGGTYQQFDGGVIVHTTRSYVVWGKIRDKWNELGGSQGKLGYPTSDETDSADGGKQTTFEHGVVTWKPGEDAIVTEH